MITGSTRFYRHFRASELVVGVYMVNAGDVHGALGAVELGPGGLSNQLLEVTKVASRPDPLVVPIFGTLSRIRDN